MPFFCVFRCCLWAFKVDEACASVGRAGLSAKIEPFRYLVFDDVVVPPTAVVFYASNYQLHRA